MKNLCKCTSAIRNVREIAQIDRFPLKGGGHTSFVIMRCLRCEGFAGFPQDNFDLALAVGTPAAKKGLRNFLREHGK